MESLRILALQEFREGQAGGPDGRILSFVLCTPVSDKHQATWINYSSMIVRKYCFHGEGGEMIKVCINPICCTQWQEKFSEPNIQVSAVH